NADAAVTGNTAFDHYYAGIYLRGPRHQARDNLVYGNRTGIDAYNSSVDVATRIVVAGNTVRNNTNTGVYALGAVRVAGNTVHNTPTGISVYYPPGEVIDNTVYANATGIYGSTDAVVRGNRVYNNTGAGLSVGSYNTVFENNTSYGNRWGLVVGSSFSGRVA